MTNLLQSLEATPVTPEAPTGNVDYVAWATEKFRQPDGTLDVAALARGKWESDINFVPRVLTELQEARKEAQTRASLEDFIEDYKAGRNVQTNTSGTPPVESPAQNSSQTAPTTLADIVKQVEQNLSQKQAEQQAQKNIDISTKALQAKWGAQARDKVIAKAQELEMSVDALTSIAARSPKAFQELVFDKAPAAPPVPAGQYVPPRSNTNANTVLNTAGAKTRKQWNDMRRTMSANKYWTPEVQDQILADKTALGSKFDQ